MKSIEFTEDDRKNKNKLGCESEGLEKIHECSRFSWEKNNQDKSSSRLYEGN